MDNEKLLDISWGSILKIAVLIFCLYIFYLIREILTWIIFAFVISLLFNPAIDFLEKRKIPRFWATLLTYTTILGIFIYLIYLISPVFIEELQQFSQLLPHYFEKIAPLLKSLGFTVFESFETFINSLKDKLVTVSSHIFNLLFSVSSGIFSIFILAIFFSLEEKEIENFITLISPQKYQTLFLNLWKSSQVKISRWLSTRILASFFVGILTLFACKILDIGYAFSFSILAGLTNLIPFIGPIFSGTLIFLFTALDSTWKAIFILIIFILIQQIEGNILTPILINKFIGLPPALVLIALMIGGKLWGILGAILAIPLAGILFEFLRDFFRKEENSV